MILAYAVKFGNNSSNMAEALALLWGVKFMAHLRRTNLVVEGYSNLIIEVFNWHSKTSWSLVDLLLDVKMYLDRMGVQTTQYTFREGNYVENKLVGLGFRMTVLRCWRQLASIHVDIITLIESEGHITTSKI